MVKKAKPVGHAAADLRPAEPQKPDLTWVRSPDGKPFWERNPDQPGGEVWVAGESEEPSLPVQVALTGAVQTALKAGRLEKCQPPANMSP